MKRLFVLGLFLVQAVSVFAQRDKPAIQLTNTPVKEVISLYAELTERSALIVPSLPAATLSLEVPVEPRTNAARVIAEALAAKDILVIPDGPKFVMVVPKSWEKTVRPEAAQIPPPPSASTNHVFKSGTINFPNVSAQQVLELYAGLAKAKIDPASPQLPPTLISFSSTTPLTTEEAMYALRTLLLWSGIKITSPTPGIIRAEPVGSL